MMEFEAGSIRTLTFRTALPIDYVMEEIDLPLKLDLSAAEITATIGPIMTSEAFDIERQKEIRSRPAEFIPIVHLTKAPQDFKFHVTMPGKPGFYILSSSLPFEHDDFIIDETTARLRHKDEGRNIHIIEASTK